MLTTEFKVEDAIAVWREEGLEEGIERGIERGVDISALILRELIKGKALEEIAERYQVSVEKVMQLKAALAGT